MKPLASAKTHFDSMPNGSFELTIQHSTIKGVTPAMLEWWFKNIDGEMELDGALYPRYTVWHPLDHIQWQLVKPAPTGGADVGACFRIMEAFGADPRMRVDSTEEVVKLDETGIRLVRRFAGIEVLSLEHWFMQVPGGTDYMSRMQVGHERLLGRFVINPFLKRNVFTVEMGAAWLKHNVEEVGNFEHFLPELYRKETMNSVSINEPDKSNKSILTI